ncbi:MAG TPA: lipase family protein [Myxococcaceae bacterium]|nr:lipase family protein [Myxococcaceae bacterium]
MTVERIVAGTWGDPFPVYPDLAGLLAAAHLQAPLERDATVAHALGVCAGYAYGDTETVSTMMSRVGFSGHACVRIQRVVDAMFVYSTAYILQSPCGRVAVVCFRGTEPAVVGNWLADMDLGPDSSTVLFAGGAAELRVHGGFHRNLRATWWTVLDELTFALAGKSLADHGTAVPHPLEVLYVCGHSLGGGMALLFGLKLAGDPHHRALAERVRAVYTFGQPMAVLMPLPPEIEPSQSNVFRHVLLQDPIPALPAATWGPFVHVGREYRFLGGAWRHSPTPVEQLPTMRHVPRIVLSFFESEARREADQYAFSEHGPQHYLSALRPPGRVTEFGDWTPP